ncbi:cobyric acid synthase [Colwelliaceae bacterium 6471]
MNNNIKAKTLMIQGTTSDAGKSTLVAALCRLYARRGTKVAPFKPQNMALNSAVTPCGGEIGRAQAVQAKAANLPLDVDFNPILLKPNSDIGAQVIIHGKAITDMDAVAYHDYKKVAADAVMQSHQRLTARYELVMVEGAGSPAEINLREGDIANMGFAERADCPVIIIADIDKGGVFAHLVGTLMLLSQSEQDRVIGFVINRFRGDIALLNPGLAWLEQKTNKPVLGVLPYIHNLEVAAEDAVDTQQRATDTSNIKLRVVVLVFSHMSNHTDFDALRVHPEIDCQFVFARNANVEHQHIDLPACDLIILPGSKNVRADLAFMKAQGWPQAIAKHLRYGGKVFGICGGFQMLGESIADPYAIEGEKGESAGLGYFPMQTILQAEKTLLNVSGSIQLMGESADVSGYEIHAGESYFNAEQVPILNLNGEMQGHISDDGQIAGCYLHGLFDCASALNAIMQWVGVELTQTKNINDIEEQAINHLADVCQQHLDINKIDQILEKWSTRQ